jgi:glutathione peroxidase
MQHEKAAPDGEGEANAVGGEAPSRLGDKRLGIVIPWVENPSPYLGRRYELNFSTFRFVDSDMTINEIPITTIDGSATSLAEYDGKVKLIVNVASRCGLAPQYEKLEALQKKYEERGFTVLGFPSNQFLQELSTEDAIKEYCSTTWGVTFPMFEKIKVNGRNEHPLYTELKKTPDTDGKAGKVKWNFEKFVVTPDGKVFRFRPKTEPDDPAIVSLIESTLPA